MRVRFEDDDRDDGQPDDDAKQGADEDGAGEEEHKPVTVLTLLVQVFAAITLVFGLVAMISPIPFGLPIVVVSLAILVSTNPRLARRLRKWRKNHPETDKKIRKVTEKLPEPLAEPIRKTDP